MDVHSTQEHFYFPNPHSLHTEERHLAALKEWPISLNAKTKQKSYWTFYIEHN
jgi:hypothetical protein